MLSKGFCAAHLYKVTRRTTAKWLPIMAASGSECGQSLRRFADFSAKWIVFSHFFGLANFRRFLEACHQRALAERAVPDKRTRSSRRKGFRMKWSTRSPE